MFAVFVLISLDLFGSVQICLNLWFPLISCGVLLLLLLLFAVAVVAVVVVVALRLDKVSSRSDWIQGVL